MKDDLVPLNVRIPRALRARLKARAAMRGRTMQEWVIEVVAEQLDRQEREDREAGRG